MTNKKLALTIVAVVLICALSVAGTLAYLTMSTQEKPVINTFMSAGNLAEKLELKEIKVEQKTDGTIANLPADQENYTDYADGANWVYANTYNNLMPGITTTKDATIKITEKNADAPSYLYMEVVDKTTDDVDWELVSTGWDKIEGLVGANNGDVYVWVGEGNGEGDDAVILISGEYFDFNAKITTDPAQTTPITITGGDAGDTITYYAYLAQASIGTAEAAYTASFKA